MKRTRLLLMGILASLNLAVQAQSYLPQKNSFTLGGGMMWSISDPKRGFQDVAGNPTCGEFILDYRHYPIANIGIGATYNHLTGNKDNNLMRCNYVAPTFTARWLWAENRQGFWITVGLGYLHYKDEVNSYEYKKGYLAVSSSLGYEFALGRGVGMQIRADILMSDFKYTGNSYYPSYSGDYRFHDDWDSSLNFFSLGLALTFGK